MPEVAVLGDVCSGHGCFPSRPNIQGSPDVMIGGKPVHRQGDAWANHCCPKRGCHSGVTSKGSSTVFVNGKAVARKGDPVSCGSTIMTGNSTVIIG